jgi:very-short-patch-repair endonuclease
MLAKPRGRQRLALATALRLCYRHARVFIARFARPDERPLRGLRGQGYCIWQGVYAPSPRLRGEGWGEGERHLRRADYARTQAARRLRRNATMAEHLVWRSLRSRALGGFKFVRQEPIAPYIVDFVCREIDGGQPAENRRDLRRDQWLRSQGYEVVRFWNNDVIQNLDGVLEIISNALLVEGAPHPDPLPARGEREQKRCDSPGCGGLS